MLKLAKDHPNVKNVTKTDGKILVWFTGKGRPVEIHTPDDLFKTGIQTLDWKGLQLDQQQATKHRKALEHSQMPRCYLFSLINLLTLLILLQSYLY